MNHSCVPQLNCVASHKGVWGKWRYISSHINPGTILEWSTHVPNVSHLEKEGQKPPGILLDELRSWSESGAKEKINSLSQSSSP
jgi:hypothetical protein